MRTVTPERERLHTEAARLRAMQVDMDPTGAAYQRLGEEIDQVLAMIWELGPAEA